MPTNTPNIGLIKSDVGGNIDSWGGNLNTNEDIVDALFDPLTGHLHSGGAGDAPPLPPASLEGVALDGLVVASGTAFETRSVQGTTGTNVVNGDGVAGDPTVVLSLDNLTAAPDVAVGDILGIYDISLAAMRRITVLEALRIAAEADVSLGVSTDETVSPRGLSQSVWGTRPIVAYCVDLNSEVIVEEGVYLFRVPDELDGHEVIRGNATVVTPGSGGLLFTAQVHNLTRGWDVFSTPITIDPNETDSDDASTPSVVNPAGKVLTKGDLLRFDVDAVSDVVQRGLTMTVTPRLP